MNSAKEMLSTVNTLFKTAVAYGTSALVIGGGTLMYASGPQIDDSAAQAQIGEHSTGFVVEVKGHLSTNRQNDIDPAEGDKVFSRGDYAVLDGTIYPDGSIPRGHNAEPLPGARPLGKYVQRGVFTTDMDQFSRAVGGDRDVSSTFAFFTEVLVFEDGSTILMVLGGTGRFRDVVGEVLEENIGEDTDGLCNLRMTFRIRRAARFSEHDR